MSQAKLSFLQKKQNIRVLFYTLWGGLLFFQATFTELIDDEAYYWYYSKYLDWGYFDHPPMIALFIKFGSLFLGRIEFGVRLFVILANLITIYLWEKIIQPANIALYYFIVSSVAVLHFYGFVATPDAPLLLFSTLSFYFYRQFIENENLQKALFLGISAALMFLSKYHGVLLALMVLLSNLKLLKNRLFWIALGITTICIFPHFLWQINHDFPSVRYHLFGRSRMPYSIPFTLEYLFMQPFVFGPFTGLFILWANFKEKAQNAFEKSLQFVYWGGLLFFLVMTFKGRVEPHWTLLCLFPGIYFTYRYLEKHLSARKIFYYSLPPAYIIILLARVFFIFTWDSPTQLKELSDYHHNKKWVQAIHRQLGDLPVAFMNSYQKPSLYYFYSGVEAFSLNNIQGRKNQFDIWDFENKYRGKTVAVIPNYDIPVDTIAGTHGQFKYVIIENFQVFPKIQLELLSELKEKYHAFDSLKLDLKIQNNYLSTYKENIDLNANKEFPTYIYYHFEQDNKVIFGNKTTVKLENQMLDTDVPVSIFILIYHSENTHYFSL